MTLPDFMDKENTMDSRRMKALTLALTSSLRQAVRRKGFTSGMTACVELLQSDPGCIMLCILPTNCEVGISIHHTLIQAFCRENGIAIMQVDSCEKLVKLVQKLEQKLHRREMSPCTTEASCLLIKRPKKETSKQDKTILDFHQEMSRKPYPMPVLTLPD